MTKKFTNIEIMFNNGNTIKIINFLGGIEELKGLMNQQGVISLKFKDNRALLMRSCEIAAVIECD